MTKLHSLLAIRPAWVANTLHPIQKVDENCTRQYSKSQSVYVGLPTVGDDMDKPKLFSTTEAAEYLGVHPQTVKYQIYETKRLVPDYQIGGDLVFLQSTLDAFQSTNDRFTMQETADYLGVSLSRIRDHVLNRKTLVADGKRGRQATFSKALLDEMRPVIEARRPRTKAAPDDDKA